MSLDLQDYVTGNNALRMKVQDNVAGQNALRM